MSRKIGDVILDLQNISLRFGGVKALTDISFNIREHEVRAIIGPNGAGKSSMLNVINGVYHPQDGKIFYRGAERKKMEPQILLLDEPMAGMNVEEKQDMCRFILDVNDQFGTTIVLIEHDMGVVMDISDRVVVLDYGKKIGDGLPDEVRASPEVIKAYLGAGH